MTDGAVKRNCDAPAQAADRDAMETSPELSPATRATAPSATTTTTAAVTTTSSSSSPALLDKILSRVKMLGRARTARAAATAAASLGSASVPDRDPDPGPPPRRTTSETGAVAVDVTAREASDSDSIVSTASSGYTFNDPCENGMKFTVKDLVPFCEQLDRLLDYIHSTADLNHIIYNCPSKLQSLLDAQANELRTINLEARAARLRIQQVKNQRKAVRKECKAMEKSLALINEEEIKEMENYIALYDKTLMTRWGKINSSTQEDVVDSFIHDIKGKQKALEYLHTLASNKLKRLQNNSISPSATEESKPVSLALRRLSASTSGRSSTGRWRSKHHERAVRAPSTNTSQEGNPSLPLVPVATAPISLTLGPAFAGMLHNGATSRTSPQSTFGSASSSLLPTNMSAMSNSTSPPTPDTPERRSIFQALFSDIQNTGTHDNLPINAVMPRLVSTTSAAAAHNQGGRETDSQNGTDIELYNLEDQ